MPQTVIAICLASDKDRKMPQIAENFFFESEVTSCHIDSKIIFYGPNLNANWAILYQQKTCPHGHKWVCKL